MRDTMTSPHCYDLSCPLPPASQPIPLRRGAAWLPDSRVVENTDAFDDLVPASEPYFVERAGVEHVTLLNDALPGSAPQPASMPQPASTPLSGHAIDDELFSAERHAVTPTPACRSSYAPAKRTQLQPPPVLVPGGWFDEDTLNWTLHE